LRVHAIAEFAPGQPVEKPLVSSRFGAANTTRTCDPVITNDVLYQLSYCGGWQASLHRTSTDDSSSTITACRRSRTGGQSL
jgi:hypothetical protein